MLSQEDKKSLSEVTLLRFALTYLVLGVIFSILQAYTLIQFQIPVFVSVADAVVGNLLILLAGISTYNILRYYKPARDNLFYIRVWVMILALLITLLFNQVMLLLFPNEALYINLLEKGSLLRGIYNLLNLALTSVFVFLWFHFKDEQKRQQQVIDAQALTRDAELVSLRQQLQPHFLFNSLNSISALVGTRPNEARKMIQQLSDFLRGTLRKDERELISLKDELEHLKPYLDIEKVRFGHRLSTEVHVSDDYLNCKIPPLILQPIVENAIKFGLYDITGEVVITIVCACNAQRLSVVITNPFDAQTAAPQKGVGFGLTSVQRRLYLLYARNDLLHTTYQNNVFTTSVIIPQNV